MLLRACMPPESTPPQSSLMPDSPSPNGRAAIDMRQRQAEQMMALIDAQKLGTPSFPTKGYPEFE
uniref:Uncharacterized protein n=1 Tax=Desertifilum tharense IPPAS B-1220 TaxID=1781255 RepID=A0ACD5H172_9CYAN